MKRGGLAGLPFLKTLLAVHQRFQRMVSVLRFSVIGSFVWMVYASLDSEDLFCQCKWKKLFWWAMEVAQVAENNGYESGVIWCGIDNEGYIQ